jgi:hypothetical protein
MTDGQSNHHAIRTLREVADILTSQGYPMTRRAVWFAERKIFQKLRDDDSLRQLFEELYGESCREDVSKADKTKT